MKTKLWCGIGLLASVVAGAGSAMAADLGVRKAPPPVAPAFLSDWAGFYIGINGGGGWSDNSFTVPAIDKTTSGGLFGGHAGYNWQYGSVVAGLEVDFDGADLKDTVRGVEEKTDRLASARARVGYVFFPNLLAYGTGGAGWGHFRLIDARGVESDVNEFGWVAGGGLEYKLATWGLDHVLVRVEYLHYDFDKTTLAPFSDILTQRVDVVRGGLSWKF